MRRLGSIQVITGAALFGLIPLFVHFSEGLSPVAIVFWRALSAAVFSAGYLLVSGEGLKIRKDQAGHFLIWSLFLTGSMLCYTLSIRLSGMAVAGTLMGLQPLAVLLCVWIFFRERIQNTVLVACLAALGGVALLSGGSGEISGGWGIFFGVLSAGFLGLNFTYHLRFLPNERPWRLVYVQNLFQVPILLPFVLMDPGTLSGNAAVSVVAMGIICTCFAYTLIYRGSQQVNKQMIGILQLTENIIPVLCGVLFFEESLTDSALAGIILIFASAVVAGLRKKSDVVI